MLRHRLSVRFADCDPLGHVNNAAYLTYLEQARLHHWMALGLDVHWRAPGAPAFILARAEVDFESQATYGDELEVRLAVAAVGRTSFTYAYEIVQVTTGARVASARSVQVCYDYKAQRPTPIPKGLRQKLCGSLRAAPGSLARPLRSPRRTRSSPDRRRR